MNEVQKFLLKLVEEIDTICTNNDIEYYIFAGSMLGVERNEGFLPWDDDMDVVMTRKNYEKFRSIIASQLPPNRTFEEKEVHAEYPLTFGKYTSTDTANMIRSLSYGDCAAGLWIDVMHLAPMPTSKRKRNIVRNIYPVYCELYNELYIGHPYRWKGFYKRYKVLDILSKIIGKKNVLNLIKKNLDAIKEENCNDYYLCHALDADFRVFSKKCFGTPKRAKYEDIIVNISPENRLLCREAYGDGWMIVPDVNNQDVHSTITDCNMPYTVYKRDFMQFLDSETVLREYYETKQIHVKWQHKKRALAGSLAKVECQLVAMETEQKIAQYEETLDCLIKEKRYAEIGQLFCKYLAFQWKPRIKNEGVFVPISDESLFALIIYLIAEKQEFYSANRIISLRKSYGSQMPTWLNEIENLIIELRKLSVALWDKEDYHEVLDLCSKNKEVWEKYNIKDFSHAYCIASFKEGTESDDSIIKMCEKLLDGGDLSGVPDKLLGDVYKKKNEDDKAESYYSDAINRLRNGLLLLDANKAVEGVLNV